MSESTWRVVANPRPDADFEYEHEAPGPLGVRLQPVSAADDGELWKRGCR